MKTFVIIALISTLVTVSTSHGTQQQFTQSVPTSYTGTLLDGIRRLANRERIQSLFQSPIGGDCNLLCPVGTVCSVRLGSPQCIPTATTRIATVGAGYHDPLLPSSNQLSRTIGDLAMMRRSGANGPTVMVDPGYNLPVGDQSYLFGGTNRLPLPLTTTVESSYNTPLLMSPFNRYSRLIGGLTLARRARLDLQNVGGPSIVSDLGTNVGLGMIAGCGYLPPECRVALKDLNAVPKYTFDYTLNQCVQVNVCSSCARLNNPQVNLFDSIVDCTRFCQ